MKLREIALNCGLLSRILERLGHISGEKARVYESAEEEEAKLEAQKEKELNLMKESAQEKVEEKNVDKKKRKGVGYSSKVG